MLKLAIIGAAALAFTGETAPALTLPKAEAAIVRWGGLGAESHAVNCSRVSPIRIRCDLAESGYAPFAGAGAVENPAWSGTLDGIYATLGKDGRIHVSSPYWR